MAVLQTPRDLNESVSGVVAELQEVRHVLLQIKQTLSAIAGSLNKRA